MVVAVLVNRFAPSSRGLKRADPSSTSLNASTSQGEGDSYRNLDQSAVSSNGQKKIVGHRRKPFRAMACLTSLASDLDVASDWFFYWETLQNDKHYRSIHREGDEVFLIPPILLHMVLLSCISGTIMWIILATDGQMVTPLLRWLGFDKLSMGFLLFLSVIIEDIPQVILTFLVEDYYEQDQYISNFAVWNVTSSLYDTLIKIAEAYDERNDIVETGAWCKHSVEAHKSVATAVVTLSSDTSLRCSQVSRRHSAADLMVTMVPTSLPRLQFLTSSLDTSIRLWNCTESQVVHGVHESSCAQVFMGHLKGVTCLALFEPESALFFNNTRGPFFFSGCENGTVNLWSSDSVVCLRRYIAPEHCVKSIAVVNTSFMVAAYTNGNCRLWEIETCRCLALFRGHKGAVNGVCSMDDGSTFVTASEDKTLRLWDVTSVVQNPRFSLSNDDGTHSLADQSQESSEKSLEINALMDIGSQTELLRKGTASSEEGGGLAVPSSSSAVPSSTSTPALQNLSTFESNPPLDITLCERVFSGHSKAVLCVVCMEAGSIFASGSKDRKVRLWSAATGSCLNIISGHEGAVTAISPMDSITLLTGSDDKSVKAWDCMTANCLRTYHGHEGTVTSISVADDSFVTTSEDGTAKLWVVTAVEDKPASFDLLDVNDGLCKGFDPL